MSTFRALKRPLSSSEKNVIYNSPSRSSSVPFSLTQSSISPSRIKLQSNSPNMSPESLKIYNDALKKIYIPYSKVSNIPVNSQIYVNFASPSPVKPNPSKKSRIPTQVSSTQISSTQVSSTQVSSTQVSSSDSNKEHTRYINRGIARVPCTHLKKISKASHSHPHPHHKY